MNALASLLTGRWQFAAAFATCIAIIGVLAWLLGSVDLGQTPQDDEPDLAAILDDADGDD